MYCIASVNRYALFIWGGVELFENNAIAHENDSLAPHVVTESNCRCGEALIWSTAKYLSR